MPLLTALSRIKRTKGIITMGERGRWWLLIFTSLCTLNLFYGLYSGRNSILSVMLREGGWFYLTLLAVIGVILVWLHDENISGHMLALSSFVPCCLGYLAIVVFAYRIFPFIPASRGGGDYSRDEASSILYFALEIQEKVPETIIDKTGAWFSENQFRSIEDCTGVLEGQTEVCHVIQSCFSHDEQSFLLDKDQDRQAKASLLVSRFDEVIRKRAFYTAMFSARRKEFSIVDTERQNSILQDDEMIVESHKMITDSFRPYFQDDNEILSVKRSLPAVIIAETSDKVFITLEASLGDRERWRYTGRGSKPLLLFGIKRDLIATIEHRKGSFPPTDTLVERIWAHVHGSSESFSNWSRSFR